MVYKKKTRKITKRRSNKHKRVTKRRQSRSCQRGGGDNANLSAKDKMINANRNADNEAAKVKAAADAIKADVKKKEDAAKVKADQLQKKGEEMISALNPLNIIPNLAHQAEKAVEDSIGQVESQAEKAVENSIGQVESQIENVVGDELKEMKDNVGASMKPLDNLAETVVNDGVKEIKVVSKMDDAEFSKLADNLSGKLDILEQASEVPLHKFENQLEDALHKTEEEAGTSASKLGFGLLAGVPGVGTGIAAVKTVDLVAQAVEKGADSFGKVANDLNNTITDVEDEISTLEAHKDAATDEGVAKINALKGKRDEFHAKTSKRLDDATEHLGQYTPHPTKDNHLLHKNGKDIMHKNEFEDHQKNISEVKTNIATHAAKKGGGSISQNGGRIRRILKSRRDFYDTNKTRSIKGKISHNKSVKR
jgi:hypothetical protein